MKIKPHILFLFFILATTLFFHAPIFHTDLIGIHAWRQMHNQTNVRNYYRYDNNILNPRIAAYNMGQDGNILRYEFPILPWCIAQLQRIFGESIVLTRIVLFIIGLMALLGFYWLASLIFKNGWIAACGTWVMSLSPLFYYYTMNPLSDMVAMAAQIWLMACTFRYVQTRIFKYFFIAVALTSLAGLAKLPYYLFGIMPFAAAMIIYAKGRSNIILIRSIAWLSISIIPVAAWYIYAIRAWQSMGVLQGVFGGTTAKDLVHILTFHLFSWLPSHLTNPIGFIFLSLGSIVLFRLKNPDKSKLWILGSGIGVLLIYYFYELNMISTVHDYYLLPFLVFIHLFIGLGLHVIWKTQELRYLLLGVLLIMPMMVYPSVNEYYWNIDRNGYRVDWFVHSNALQQAVPRDSLCIILNDNTGVVVPYQIDKQGYVFDKDDLPAMWIEDMILRRNARYMYSDSRKVDTSASVRTYLDSLILHTGSIKVFRLKNPATIERHKN